MEGTRCPAVSCGLCRASRLRPLKRIPFEGRDLRCGGSRAQLSARDCGVTPIRHFDDASIVVIAANSGHPEEGRAACRIGWGTGNTSIAQRTLTRGSGGGCGGRIQQKRAGPCYGTSDGSYSVGEAWVTALPDIARPRAHLRSHQHPGLGWPRHPGRRARGLVAHRADAGR